MIWSGVKLTTSFHFESFRYEKCGKTFILNIEYWMDNWTISDVTGHAGVIGQYIANAIISYKSK